MYQDVSKKIKKSVSPFHQKMLRFNYDIPLPLLKEALTEVLAYFPAESVCVTEDFYEYSNQTVLSYQTLSIDAFLMKFDAFGQGNDMLKTGIFDESISYYIRLFIESEEEVSAGRERTGNFELYTKDDDIQNIYQRLTERIPAHILLDGAKKYLDEIFFY